ncbi:hypothetical protein KPH14_012191 [Odynerus spinipes]|uniref:Reverse transcriptase/retrotransposon-derived protein RNase H-like domain-containing protein n=1 Tax=Odynerus spinipes TaxID=1348599 RepID=A0AAD9VL62_9HYME|nr:hypothetical protein KPH14_012191 [Odynerus spinipes]
MRPRFVRRIKKTMFPETIDLLEFEDHSSEEDKEGEEKEENEEEEGNEEEVEENEEEERITHLNRKALTLVRDIVHDPPSERKFETLKRRALDVFEEADESKLRRLLRGHEIGDEKPTAFLQKLRNLSSGQCNDSVLKSLFMEQMPENVRAILAASGVVDLQKLATTADKIVEVTKSGINDVHGVTATAQPGAARVSAPLTAHLAGSKKRDRRLIKWDDKSTTAFEECKRRLAEASLLAHLEEGAPLMLHTDASDLAIGAALHQLQDGPHALPIQDANETFALSILSS